MQVSFSGHETFPFRYGWIKKGVDAVKDNPLFFSGERAMVDLGVGKNMVQSIKYWCSATGMLDAIRVNGGRTEYTPTEISKSIVADGGFDPYFEDPATLWLMQWRIASNPDLCATWYYLFNHWHGVEFTKNLLVDEITKWLHKQGVGSISAPMLKRDVDCCLRTYVQSRANKNVVLDESFDCPLTELNLISELADGKTYQFRRGEQKSLPDDLLLFAITDFWEKSGEQAKALSIERIAYDPGSPGQIFKLDMESLVQRLERVADVSDGIFSYQESAGLKQIFRLDEAPSFHWIDHYFRNN
jgi:Protein of unknown function (DUF4007)